MRWVLTAIQLYGAATKALSLRFFALGNSGGSWKTRSETDNIPSPILEIQSRMYLPNS